MSATAPAIDLRAAAREVMREHGLRPDFPPEVEREVDSLDRNAPQPDTTGAIDLRHLLWSSIDNRTTRDMDQIEFVEPSGGGLRVRIAIADVDAIVERAMATDAHAAHNTTSVYTGVLTFPMLPDKLSSGLTSLHEGEDRAALVVQIDVAGDGATWETAVYRALVRNRIRLDYDSVSAWLEGREPLPERAASVDGLEAQLRLQADAASRLRELRRRRGALDIDTVEARPVAVDGRVIDLAVVANTSGREMIESFMVAANIAIAQHLEREGVSSIRRVVRAPRRWNRIVALAAELGETLPPEPDRVALASFLERQRLADPDHFPDLSLSVVKLLGPGQYMLDRRGEMRPGEGHFGIAAAEYTHSTAPNRRFVDLVMQRLVKALEDGAAAPYTDEELDAIARHCTAQEDAARKVERTMRKRAAAALLADRIGDRFTAIVTGASGKGTYVRVLRPPVEGRVVRGEAGMDVGDTVRVRLVAVDAERGHIDFEGSPEHLQRKLARARRKKLAATRLRGRIGEEFDAVVTSATAKASWARLADGSADGKIVRGRQGLRPGDRIRVQLLDADPVHGFIDFEHVAGVSDRKRERLSRKRDAAHRLRHRIGEVFEATITGVTPRATWIRTADGVEGRLVRGWKGLEVGAEIEAILLHADARRGHLDFAREERTRPRPH